MIGLLRASQLAWIGAALVLFWIAVALTAPMLAPFPPARSLVPMAPPGPEFLLGTDNLGRDVLSRIVFGARTVLVYAPLATLSAYVFGVLAGLVAGYRGGAVGDQHSRAVAGAAAGRGHSSHGARGKRLEPLLLRLAPPGREVDSRRDREPEGGHRRPHQGK